MKLNYSLTSLGSSAPVLRCAFIVSGVYVNLSSLRYAFTNYEATNIVTTLLLLFAHYPSARVLRKLLELK